MCYVNLEWLLVSSCHCACATAVVYTHALPLHRVCCIVWFRPTHPLLRARDVKYYTFFPL